MKLQPRSPEQSNFTTERQPVYDALFEAAPEDTKSENYFFLGDGLSVIVQRSLEHHQIGVAFTLTDESNYKLPGFPIKVHGWSTPNKTVIQPYAPFDRSIISWTVPTNLLNNVAEGISQSEPIDVDHIDKPSAMRAISLEAPPCLEASKLYALHILIANLAQNLDE